MTGSGDADASHLSSFSFTLTTHHNGSGALNTPDTAMKQMRRTASCCAALLGHKDQLQGAISSKMRVVNSLNKAEELVLFVAQFRLDRVHERVA